jgi:hypothetical protein
MYEDIWEPTPAQSMTWLQKQQQKLRERREARYRSERTPTEIKLISELKGVQSRMKVGNKEKTPPPAPPTTTQPLAIKVNFEESKRDSPAKDVVEPKVHRFDRQRSYDSNKSNDDDPLEQVILQAQQVS